MRTTASLALSCAVVLSACSDREPSRDAGRSIDVAKISTGASLSSPPLSPLQSPYIEEIALDSTPEGVAIWGATGRDARGHIWLGVSTAGGRHSARLIEHNPELGDSIDRGGAIENLERLGLLRDDERQSKIHTKIIAASDDSMYFCSMDEQGEKEDGSSLPQWGSHCWRAHSDRTQWEHLFSAAEGLIAMAGGGRWLYALGYWGHVLYQYDTATTRLRRVKVGSVGGHTSRNFLVDERGHAFVPRLQEVSLGVSDETLLVTSLVEFDTDLNELAATPLIHYADTEKGIDGIEDNHGLTAVVHLADSAMVFATHLGHLYRVDALAGGAAEVSSLGSFHPRGPAYAPALFTYSGNRYVVGLGRHKKIYEWLVFDLETANSSAFPFDFRGTLYGSNTRDNDGRFYVVGYQKSGKKRRSSPLFLRLDGAATPLPKPLQ